MSWFSRKPTQEKYLQAAVTVASNLYLHTIPGAKDAPAELCFAYSDSRFRYMIFCLSAVASTVLAYDEKKDVQAEPLLKGCLFFAKFTAEQDPPEYFGEQTVPSDVVQRANAYLTTYAEQWSKWPALEQQNKHLETVALISEMVHATESGAPISPDDYKRLGPLGLEISCRLPTMRSAFLELAKR
jgi:hypothetical protein